MNKKGILIAAVAVLVIAIIGVTYLLFTEKQANRELVQEFQLDKEDLENEYTRFAQQYDELKMTISNDSLSQLLEQEQLKTQRLLEELRTVKSSNATEIRRLKKELATLRKVMIGYINQIDSLNKLTAQQKQVIAEVTQKYNQASRQIDNLSEEKKNLDKKVTLAAQLDATNIRVEPRIRKTVTGLALKLFRGEPAISGFDWNFSPIHTSCPPFSTDVASDLQCLLRHLHPGHG